MEELHKDPKKTAEKSSAGAFRRIKDRKWLIPAALAAALAALCVAYRFRPVYRTHLTLLTSQTETLPSGGRLRLSGTAAALEDHSLTGVEQGRAQVRVDRLTRVELYEVQVYDPVPQGTPEQRVGVDGTVTVGAHSEDYPVEWRSSDEGIATVEKGNVTGVTPGTVTITEILNNALTYTYTLTVTQPELERAVFRVYPGQSVPVNVRYYSQSVNWTADSDAVQIHADGSVTAKRPGVAVLRAELGEQSLCCTVKVAQKPRMERSLVLRTDETGRLYVNNALDKVQFSVDDATVCSVDEWGAVTPLRSGAATVTARTGGVELSSRVVVNLTPEEAFRVNNYGPYQPDTSIAALAMLGMCDYYNDVMRADKSNWYDTNLTSFSPKDTFEQECEAGRKGANCNSLLNWSWHDMGIKSGSGSKLYGQRDSGDIHGYNGSDRSLKGLVDDICTVSSAHGTRTRSLVKSGKLQPGDMLFMDLHTFIYRGEGTVFASAGDAKCHRKGKDLIFDNFINGSSSYDWNRRISYQMRFQEDYLPPKYRNKAGEVVDNPMVLAVLRGESPWTGKLSPSERRAQGLEPVTFTLGTEQSAEESTAQSAAASTAELSPLEPDGDYYADGDDLEAEGDLEPITGDITATIPQSAPTEPEPPTSVGGKTYGNHPSMGKAKRKHKAKKSEKKEKAEKKSAEKK